MFSTILPPILPAIRDRFSLSLTTGAAILTVHSLTHNGIQVFIGHLRAQKSSSLFLKIGLLLASIVCLIAVVPAAGYAVIFIAFFAIFSGSGIGMIHPEGMRGAHILNWISPSLSTAIYMTGGFLGCAFGSWISAWFVTHFGLKGLLILFAGPVIGIVLIIICRVKLSVDTVNNTKKTTYMFRYRPSFLLLVLMALPAAFSTMIIVWLLPSRLDELGFELTFGGFSMMIFSLACAAGSFFWGYAARKKEPLIYALISISLAVPLSAAYLLMMNHLSAVILLFATGFSVMGTYVLTVTMARVAEGFNLSQRMGFMVGGTWAVAGVFVLIALKFFGLTVMFYLMPIGYLVSAAVAFFIMNNAIVKKLPQ